MTRATARHTHALFIAAVASLPAACYGRLVATARDASAAQIIAQVQAWIQAHPKDAAGYQTLGRLHALAWAYGEKIPLVGNPGRGALPTFSEDSTVLVSRTAPRESLWMTAAIPAGVRQDRPVTAEDAQHLAASIAAYRKAIELNADDALSELALGWMIAQQGKYARDLPADYFGNFHSTDSQNSAWTHDIARLADENYGVRDAAGRSLLAAMPACIPALRDATSTDPEVKMRIDAVLEGYFELQALEHYRKAYALRAQIDLQGQPTYQADSQVSAEAGTQIVAILSRHPEAARKGETQAVQDVLEPLARKRQALMRMPQ